MTTTRPKGYGSGLSDSDASKLAASKVSAEVASERGYRTIDSPAQMRRHGFRGEQAQLIPALLIPLRNVWGQPGGYQIRPNEPRVLKGKVAKYETRHGERMTIDCHPRVLSVLTDPYVPLAITEGSIKEDAIVSAGGHALALLGVWGFRGKTDLGGTANLPDLGQIAWQGRRALIVFDSDVMAKSQVHQACAALGALLNRLGAEVAYAYLPAASLTKVGIDDWLAEGHSLGELWGLASPELRRIEEPGDPELAEDTFEDIPEEPGAPLLDEVAEFLRRHLVFRSEAQITAAALWAAHTHALDAFESTARLAISSPQKQSGKTRLLELLRLLCRNARLSASMTAAYLFRLVAAVQPTLLIDEVDVIFRPGDKTHEDLRALINAGHRRGATVGRMEGEGAAMAPKDFPVYTAVATAGIGLPPETIHDRAVPIRLRRRARGERVTPFRQRTTAPEGLALGRRLAAWAYRNLDKLSEAVPVMPEGIEDRPADVWEPLLAIADLAGGHWPLCARQAAQELNRDRVDTDPNLDLVLLGDLRDIMTGSSAPTRDRWSSADLCDALNRRPESRWKSLRDGYGIDPATLAAMLNPYDIHSKKVRIGERSVRGYRVAFFIDTWSRYLKEPTEEEEDA